MEVFWNIVFYFAYRFDYRLHLLFNKINPFILLYRLPHSKRNFEKLGVDPMNALNKAFKRPDIGISSIRSGGLMYVLVFLICWGTVNFYSAIIQKELNLKFYVFIIFILISFVVNHFLLFKQDKYLSYFKEFEKMEKQEKKKWGWLSLIVIIGIFLYSIGSFVFMNYRL